MGDLCASGREVIGQSVGLQDAMVGEGRVCDARAEIISREEIYDGVTN
jgi:hypothetical protein